MNDRIREAFAAVHAEEALKESTRAFLAERTAGYRRRGRPTAARLVMAAAACLAVLVVLGVWRVYFTPTATVSIEINPWVELSVNRFDRVIAVAGRNDDGAALAEELDLTFLSCDEAIQTVLADTEVAALLAEDAVMDIAVTGADEAQCGRLLSQAESCTAGWGSVHCYHAGSEEAAAAREAGLSLGKYRMYQALLALDPAITAEEVRDMTMSQLQALLENLSGGDTASTQGAGQTGQNSAGQGGGQGAGQTGTGQGAGQSSHHGYGHSSGHHE